MPMAEESLIALATRYVALAAELETVRNAMRAALANGAEEPSRPFPAPVDRPPRPIAAPGGRQNPGAKPGAALSPQAAQAQAREAELIELLKANPRASQHELARTMGSSQATISGRLFRLRRAGRIAHGEHGWTISA
jgi:hypothetical protein